MDSTPNDFLLMEHASFNFSYHLAVGRYDITNDGYWCAWKLPFQPDWAAQRFFVQRDTLERAREVASQYVRDQVIKILKQTDRQWNGSE